MKNTKTHAYHSKSRLFVSKRPLEILLPAISEKHKAADFSMAIKELTGAEPAEYTVEKTPQGRNLKVDEQGVCGHTPSGSKLIFSPSKRFSITLTSPTDDKKESIELALLVREKDYTPKQKHALFASLESTPSSDQNSIGVIATSETRESQPERKKARKESAVVKNTAKGIVCDYFKKCGISIAEEEISKENWNLCHLLSYGIAMNAKTEDGESFDTQVYDNIYSGTRALNENMMCIENVLLQLLENNDTKKIHYLALLSEFKDSHILSSLTLKIKIEKHNGALIELQIPFDISDNRKLPSETATIFYTAIQTLLKTFDPPNDESICKMLF